MHLHETPMAKTSSSNSGVMRRRRSSLLTAGALSLALVGSVAGGIATPAFAAAVNVPANAATQMPSFADVVAAVQPAVVSIRVKADAGPQMSSFNGGQDDDQGSGPGGIPFEFFKRFGQIPGGEGQGAPGAGKRAPHEMVMGQGSGFIISSDGYVVTNNHVVDKATEVTVTTNDGKDYSAKVIGTDEKTDVALLKISGDHDFPFVKFADSDVRVGDWVIAVGNPFGLGGTVTAGIVSARGRDIGSGPYDDFIQIDAPINKGNSGGPTFNLKGDVVGMNTAIYSPTGGSVGIGFDIPAETVSQIVSTLKTKGVVTRGWLGVQIQPITDDIADSLGLKSDKGALVAEAQSDSPAVASGIKSGDAILAVDGKPVASPRELAKVIAGYEPGTTVKVDVWRGGKSEEVAVKLGKLPTKQQQAMADDASPQDSSSEVGQLGLTVAPASAVGKDEKGVAVVKIDPDGPAADKGVQVGDVIVAAGGKPVGDAKDVAASIEAAKADGRKAVLLQLKQGSQLRFVALPIAKA
ncbi:serine protease Do [Pseudoxanthobacter soli DSM 19599]|uniref:Probable periplasmic serine endoprotease DegP-like n=2 Tax=Pseudoxanthobacter TaxID=433838 RepID=A0A1M7ZMX0_9HYPH|nr:serine protease Do [Pseudoxanthobacter soli DSM 19599]